MVKIKTHGNKRSSALGGGVKVKIGILTTLVALVLFGLTFSSCKQCCKKENKPEDRNGKTSDTKTSSSATGSGGGSDIGSGSQPNPVPALTQQQLAYNGAGKGGATAGGGGIGKGEGDDRI